MSYKILEQNGTDNENIDGGAFNRFAAGGRDGIMQGVLSECSLIAEGNGISIQTGLIFICGIRVKITSTETLFVSSVPITPMQYQIVAQITLNDNHSVRFELFLRSPDSLRQDAIYRDGHGVYQVEIGSFVHNPDGTLTNIVKTLDVICGGGAGGGNFEVGEIKTETLDAGLEAEFDVTQRIDGNGKMLLDFYAGIPKGESGKDSAAVHFNEVQDLAEEQKKQARENIGAQEKIAVFSVTIPSSRWIGNRAVLSASDNAEISRLTANSNIEFVSSDESAANVINYNVIASDVTNGAITFTRSSSFTGNITGTIIIISF